MPDSALIKPSLGGVRGKLNRAKDHFEDLKRIASERTYAEASHSERIDHEAQQRIIEARLKGAPEVPLSIRLLVGDVVHNLAATLDHLIYQLSLSHQLRIGTINAVDICDDGKTAFPVFMLPKDETERRETESRINKRLKLMAQEPANIIRSMQPYKRAEADPSLDPSQDPLWILFKLDVIDKHRVVLATDQSINVNRLTFSHPTEPPEIIEVGHPHWQPFKDGAKLFEVTLGINEAVDPQVHFNLEVSLNIKLAETGLWCDGKPVVGLLEKLIIFTERAVLDRLSKYVI